MPERQGQHRRAGKTGANTGVPEWREGSANVHRKTGGSARMTGMARSVEDDDLTQTVSGG
ncbi:hypothetical protein GCM10027089_53990 [Nocardia thraciensis]